MFAKSLAAIALAGNLHSTDRAPVAPPQPVAPPTTMALRDHMAYIMQAAFNAPPSAEHSRQTNTVYNQLREGMEKDADFAACSYLITAFRGTSNQPSQMHLLAPTYYIGGAISLKNGTIIAHGLGSSRGVPPNTDPDIARHLEEMSQKLVENDALVGFAAFKADPKRCAPKIGPVQP